MAPETPSLANEQFVALTTFRRNGERVTTPVWVAPDPEVPGSMVVVTDRASGKVKRLRNTPSIELQPCDPRGRLRGDATPGTAVVLDGPDSDPTRERAHAALRSKYGWQARLLDVAARFRRGKQDRVHLRLTPGA